MQDVKTLTDQILEAAETKKLTAKKDVDWAKTIMRELRDGLHPFHGQKGIVVFTIQGSGIDECTVKRYGVEKLKFRLQENALLIRVGDRQERVYRQDDTKNILGIIIGVMSDILIAPEQQWNESDQQPGNQSSQS